MAFSALLSWETPTTALRIRIVKICTSLVSALHVRSAKQHHVSWRAPVGTTYNSGVDECAPSTVLFKQGQHERDCRGTEENDHELVLELLEDELPQRCGGFFGDLCRHTQDNVSHPFLTDCTSNSRRYASMEHATSWGASVSNLPFLPCFILCCLTCSSVKPFLGSTLKLSSTLWIECAKEFSMTTRVRYRCRGREGEKKGSKGIERSGSPGLCFAQDCG
jgi:hypothetical protein